MKWYSWAAGWLLVFTCIGMAATGHTYIAGGIVVGGLVVGGLVRKWI